MAKRECFFFCVLFTLALSNISFGKQIELGKGWNAVGLPFGYEISAQTNGYAAGEIYFATDEGRMEKMGEFRPRLGEGFWVYSSDGIDLELTGAPSEEIGHVVSLSKGWNFVGNPYEFSISAADAVRAGGESFRASRVIRPYFYYYREDIGEYVAAEILEPWKAYFIYSAGDCSLEFSPVRLTEEAVGEIEDLSVPDFLPDTPVVAGSGGEPDYIADQLLVTFKDGKPPIEAVRELRAAGFEVAGANTSAGVYNARATGITLAAAQEIASKLENVSAVSKNYLLTPGVTPNDAVFANPPVADAAWGFIKIGMPQVWKEYSLQRQAIVAILDTGVDANHPELLGRVLAGKNFVNPGTGAGTWDDNGHGTNVAGIIAAKGNNSEGMAGVCWDCEILPVKVCGAAGQCPLFSVINGISYAASLRAPVINVSLGGYFPPGSSAAEMLSAALDLAAENGSVVVAAAGNDDRDAGSFLPAALPSVIAAGATDINDARAPFSNFGPSVDIAGPGVNIYTTNAGGGYSFAEGTSMSAAFVSGVAALLYSADATMSGAALKSVILESSSDPVQNLYKPVGGRINAAKIFSRLEPLQNFPPIITKIVANPSVVAPGGQALLEVEAQDIEGDEISWLWAATAGQIDNPTARATTWRADDASPGEHGVSVTVSDSRGASAIAMENIAVMGAEDALVVTPDYAAAKIGGEMRFSASIVGSDGSETPVSAIWEELSGLGEIDSAGLFTPGAVPGEAVVRATFRHLSAEARVRVYDHDATPMGGERAIEFPAGIKESLQTASGGSWSQFQTSAFLIGSVSVSVVFFESNGALDTNLYDWTPAQKAHAFAQIQQGLSQLAAQEPRANISFVYEAPITFQTKYEPTPRPSSQDGLYITEFLQSEGFAGDKLTATFRYNDFIRTKNNTHWAYTIYMVAGEPYFDDGWFAYAYINGPYAMLTYENNGWGPNDLYFVTAHETGHIFGAGDQYSGSCGDCTTTYGYLQGPNSNCYLCPGSVPSLMKCDSMVVDASAAVQLGWRDLDGDDVLCPVDPQNGGSSKIVVVPEAANVDAGTPVDIEATLYNFKNHTIPGAKVEFTTNTGSLVPANETTYLEGAAGTTLSTVCAEHTVQISAPGAALATAHITGTCEGVEPKNLQATVVCPYVSLTWESGNDPEYDRYTVSRATTPDGPYTEIESGVENLFYVGAVPGDGTYYYVVHAYKNYDTVDQTGYSNETTAIVSCASTTNGVPCDTEWRMFGCNNHRSGESVSSVTLPLKLAWWFTTGDRVNSTPAVADGMVFFGSQDKKVYAVNELTGDVIWQTETGGAIDFSSPAVSEGKVYIGSWDGFLYAFNQYTGQTVWEYDTNPPSCTTAITSSPAVSNGMVVFTTMASTANIYAVDQHTGDHIWHYLVPGKVSYSSPAVADGKVFYMASTKLYALNLLTGTKIWEFETSQEYLTHMPSAANGMVFIGVGNGFVHALNQNTGETVWEYEAGNPVYSFVASGDLVYFGAGNKVIAINQFTGEKEWDFTTPMFLNNTPMTLADGKLFLLSGMLYVLDQFTGEELFNYIESGSITSSISAAGGRLFAGVGNEVIALETEPHVPPSNLVAAANCPNIELTWEAASPSSYNRYTVSRAAVSGGPHTVLASDISALSYTDANPGDGSYYYIVTAYKGEYNGAPYYYTSPAPQTGPSNEANIVLSCAAPPANLTAEKNCPGVELTWDACGDLEYDRYTVSRADVSGGPYTEIATGIETLSYTDAAPGDGMYFYVVNGYKSGNPAFKTDYGNELAVSLFCSVSPDESAPCDAEWPQYMCNNNNTGASASHINTPISKIWEFNVGSYVYSSTVVSGGKVIFGADDNKLYALDDNSGTKIWEYTTGGKVRSSPAVANGKVFFGSTAPDTNVYALDESTGTKIWEYQTFNLGGVSGIKDAPAAAYGKVFAASGHVLYALDQDDGEKIWEFNAGSWIESAPAVADGAVFFGSNNSKVYALDQEFGVKLWEFDSDDIIGSSPSVADGRVFVGTMDKVYAMNQETGELLWTFDSDGAFDSSFSTHNGKLFFGSPSGVVYALDQTTGAKSWEFDTALGMDVSPIVADGKVFVSPQYGLNHFVLDENTGSVIHTFLVPSNLPTGPAIANGKLYIGFMPGVVAAFGAEEVSATPPSNLAAVIDCPDVELTWDAAAPAEYDRYTVSRSTTSGGPYTEIATGIAALSYTDAMPGDGVYYYVVHSYKSSAPSDVTGFSNETYAETACAPYLNIFGTCEPELAWNPAPNPAMDRFRVLRSTSPGGPYTEIVSGLSSAEYQDSSVADASTYFYVVKAYRSSDPSKESDPSNEVALTTECAPDGLEALMSCPQVNIKWEPSNGTEFDRFTLYRSTVSGGPYAQVTTGLEDASYTDTPPSSSGETYYYVVRAYKSSNPAITTGYSNELIIENFLCPYPEPTDLVATLACPDVSLSWDGVPTASGYKLYRADASGGPYSLLELNPSNPHTDTSVVDGQTYYYVVTAYYSTLPDEESGYSNEASVAVACAIPPPTPPSNLAATVACPDVELTWDAAAPAEYDRYAISRATAPGGPYAQIATGIGTLSYTDLDPGDGTYYYIVHAYKSSNPAEQTASSGQASTLLNCSVYPPNDEPCDASWPGFLCNNSNTGESVSVVNLPLAKAWEFNTGGQVFSSPAIAEGKVFIGSNNKKIYAFDQNTGAKIWEYATGNVVYSAPAVADGKVFVGSADKKVYAFDQNTGEEIWEYATGGAVYSSPAVADGKVFIGSYDNRIYALDQNTGEKIWEYTTGGPIYASPGVADGKVLVGSGDKKFYALDQNTGEKIWEYFAGRFVISSPAVADGKVFVGSYDNNRIYALNLNTGDKIWEYETDSLVWASLAAANGKVFFGLLGGKVNAIDQNTGAKIWEYATGGAVYSSPAVADGKVFIGSNDKKVYALDQNTGANLWEYATGSGVRSSPAVADGRVFFGSNDGKVYSFKTFVAAIPPSNLAATVACPDVELTWNAAAPAEYDRYTVSRATAPGGPYAQIATGIETLSNTDLDPGDGTYYYIVHAYKSSNPAEQTASSVQTSAVVNCVPPPPTPPSNLAATVACPDVELTWDAAAPAEYDRYAVSRATAPGGPYAQIATGIGTLSYTDLDPGDGTYYYIVHAYKSSNPAEQTASSGQASTLLNCSVYPPNDEPCDASWPGFLCNNSNTGESVSVVNLPLAKAWEFNTGGQVFSSPAIAEGKVFIGSNNKKIYAFDQNTGAKIWEYATGNVVYSAPAVADGKVFVGSADKKVYAFDQNTGEEIWEYATGGAVYSSPAVADGKVFIGSYDNRIYALDQNTGEKIWEYTTGGPIYASPGVADGKVLVGSGDKKFYALDQNTGEKIWEYFAGRFVISSPAVADGKVFVGSYDNNRIYALDLNTGDKIWEYTTDSLVWASLAAANGKVYFGLLGGKAYALDQNTGVKIWEYATGGAIYSSPAVADGKVFIGSNDKKVYAIDQNTGANLWEYATGSGVRSSPAVADGRVFFGSNDGKVYSLGP